MRKWLEKLTSDPEILNGMQKYLHLKQERAIYTCQLGISCVFATLVDGRVEVQESRAFGPVGTCKHSDSCELNKEALRVNYRDSVSAMIDSHAANFGKDLVEKKATYLHLFNEATVIHL